MILNHFFLCAKPGITRSLLYIQFDSGEHFNMVYSFCLLDKVPCDRIKGPIKSCLTHFSLEQFVTSHIKLNDSTLQYPGGKTNKFQELMFLWRYLKIDSLGPRDAIGRHISGSTLAQVMACCLPAPSLYPNQCWLITSKVQWHTFVGNFTRDCANISH